MANPKVYLEHHGQVHCIAQCNDCDWSDEDFIKASGMATAHTKETGHSVRVEKAITYTVHLKK